MRLVGKVMATLMLATAYGTLPFSSAGAFNGQHAADMGDVARLLQL